MVPDGYFSERVAARYDRSDAEEFAPAFIEAIVDFLVERAGARPALELGIGTGRIALPLAQRGVPVQGIDLSEAMVARLRAKPRGDDIGVTLGDFATTRVEGPFSLVYLVFNTIMNLTTQAAQVACFQNVAAHLEPGGCFVVEVGVPSLQRLPPGERYRAYHVDESRWDIDEFDVAAQGLISHHFTLVDGRLERDSIPFRYVWPSELDLMAQLAGLSLRERWGGWKREPFTSDSRKHVSVWEKPADARPAGGARSQALARLFEAKAQEALDTLVRLDGADWKQVTAAEKWPVGVTAHHLAGAFEVISHMIRAHAAGLSLERFGLASIDESNARHAKEFASCTKAETVALHRKGVAAAAAAIRELSDAALDRSGTVIPGAPPMTTEQLIHAALLGHIDQHYGSIRKTVGH